jgi:hypothetical protein
MSRAFKRVLAAFAAAATTATYTEQLVSQGGQVNAQRQVTRSWFEAGAEALISVAIPAAVAAGVDAIHFQGCFNPGDSDATWYDVRGDDGELITIESVQTVKGDVVAVAAAISTFHALRLVPVDSGNSATAPGAVTFEIGVKE